MKKALTAVLGTQELADTLKQLTKAQLRAFELIAINLDFGVHPKTAAALLKHGLIETCKETLPSWPTPVTITRYFLPVPVHLTWCLLCAEQAEAGKAKETTDA